MCLKLNKNPHTMPFLNVTYIKASKLRSIYQTSVSCKNIKTRESKTTEKRFIQHGKHQHPNVT